MDDSKKDELSVNSSDLKNISILTNSNNKHTNSIYEQNSQLNKILNEKISGLFVKNQQLISIKTIEKISHLNFKMKYCNNEYYYNSVVIGHIIDNEPGHIVAEFKDFLIMGDINEFLQNYYKTKESKYLLVKILEYYSNCSIIFPNYIILPESQYIYRNIQRKQKVIDVQQELEDIQENKKKKKNKLKKQEEDDVFTDKVLDSILNQTDTSGLKQFFGVSSEGNSIYSQLDKIIDGINCCENDEKELTNILKSNSKYEDTMKGDGNSLKNAILKNNQPSNKKLPDNKKKGRNYGNSIYKYITANTDNRNIGINNLIYKSLRINCNSTRNNKNNSISQKKTPMNINDKNVPRILKKSLIYSLLNSNQGIDIYNHKFKKTKSRTILGNNNFLNNKTSINSSNFDSITKISINKNLKKKSQNKIKKEIIMNKMSSNNNHTRNESEFIYNKIQHHRLFSGFTNLDKNLIYHKKKNDDKSPHLKKKKNFTNYFKNKYFSYKLKNFSSYNILKSSNLQKDKNNIINTEGKNLFENIDSKPKTFREKEKVIKFTNHIKHKKNSPILMGSLGYMTQLINSRNNKEKKVSEKNLKSSFAVRSPKYLKSNTKYNFNNLDYGKQKIDENFRPLTMRESMNKNKINIEVIEVLTNKINKIKEYIKESDKKDKNTIFQIFRKKKVIRKRETPKVDDKYKKKINNGSSHSNCPSSISNLDKISYTCKNLNNKKQKKQKIRKNVIDVSQNSNPVKNNHLKKKSNYNIINEINFFSITNYNIKLNNHSKDKKNKKNVNLNNNKKTSTLKVIPLKHINQNNKSLVKGIKINGFDKLMSKSNINRNIDFPKAMTDRTRKNVVNYSNIYTNSIKNNKKKLTERKGNGNIIAK